MKRMAMMTALLASVSAFAYMGGGDRAWMADELGLSSEQKSKIKTIRKAARDERIKLMDKLDDLRDETHDNIMAVLDEKQKAKFITLKKSLMKKGMKRRGEYGNRGGCDCERGTMGDKKGSCAKQ